MTQNTIKALVEDISPVTDSIMRVILTPKQFIDYQAGQYLQIVVDQEAFSYSIANAPLGSHKYELHIRHSSDNVDVQRILTQMRQEGFVTIRLPFGVCSMEYLDPQRPILFIAGGTGFAPVKAMIEHLLSASDSRPFELFWGARVHSDLYLDALVTRWQAHVDRFNYYFSISEENNKSLVSLVLDKHRHHLNEWQIVISGPFDMVYKTRDILINEGALPTHLFSDAFSIEVKKS